MRESFTFLISHVTFPIVKLCRLHRITGYSSHRQTGFTIIEVVVVMTAMSILIGLVSVSLITVREKADTQKIIDVLVSDIRGQQLKTMVGDTEGSGDISRFGIYFTQNSYVLFRGDAYASEEPTNFEVFLPEDITFSTIDVPSSQLVFDIGTGEVVLYDDESDSVNLSNEITGDERIIELNRLGVIVSPV